MSTLVAPTLVHDIRAYGRFDVNGCMNCGTCTLSCDLSQDDASFPRRIMQRAIMGLRGQLLAGPEPWLCHDCGDCTYACPRDTEPRESMKTLRRYVAAQYDVTGLARRIGMSKTSELASILVVAAIVFALVVLYHLYYVDLALPDFVETPMGLEHMFNTIIYFTAVVYALPVLILFVNVARMRRFIFAFTPRPTIGLYFREIKTLIEHTFVQTKMSKCREEGSRSRWIKHMMMVFAFTAKSIIVLFFLRWFQTDSVLPLYDPQRWLGYLIALVLIVVPSDILIGRARKAIGRYKFSDFGDLALPVMLLLAALSGLAVHVFRYMEFAMACHYSYALHVAVVTSLLVIELPFGKLSHSMYRSVAIFFQRVEERRRVEARAIDPGISGERGLA